MSVVTLMRPASGGTIHFSRTLIRLVPCVTAETLGVCRILLGGSILYFLLQYEASSLDSLSRNGPGIALTRAFAGPPALVALSASPVFCTAFYWTMVALAIAVVIGWRARASMMILTVCLWLAALLWNYGHFLTPLLLGMTAAMFAPWGAGLSVDAGLARQREGARSPLNGYAIWLLGLAIGLAYASAGISKLVITHGAWLWNTGSRNGFIQDFSIAFTDLGLVFTNTYALALVASVISAVGQIAYVYSSFTRNAYIKYAICYLIALPFLVALVIFMGHFWWPWAILILILYLPWDSIDRRLSRGYRPFSAAEFPTTGSGQRQRSIFLASAGGLIGLHVMAVAINKEFEPLFSNYPMYIAKNGIGPNTPEEARLWKKRVAHGYHFRPIVHLIARDGTERDISLAYRIGEFSKSRKLYRSAYPRLHARWMYHQAHRNVRVPPDVCQAIRVAAHRISDGTAQFVRYNAHFYDLTAGAMSWRAIDPASAVTFDVAACTYMIGQR